MEFFESTLFRTLLHWLSIIVPSQRIYFLYLLSAIILAFISYLSLRALEAHEKPEQVKNGFLRYVFDWSVFGHRSSFQDYKYFIINGLVYYGIISQLLVGMHTFSNFFLEIFNFSFGALAVPLFDVTPFWVMTYTVVVILCFDFAVYLLHYLHHRIPFFWEFHKVHHSAEVLNPMTLFRMHPVDLFLTGSAATLMTGLAFAGFFYLTGKQPSAFTLHNLNVIVFAFYLLGYNLRHSHIWLNYPQWVSYIFISPAQHQIHHSSDPKHFDKNMGLIFSFWDNLFGTLYIPKKYEKLTYGLSRENPNPYKSVFDLYWMPVRDGFAILQKATKSRSYIVTLLSLIAVVLVYFSFLLWERQVLADQFKLPSVHIEDLTWTEVQTAQEKGYNTIIIPTGGTEQNGPHVILGKHNYIIKYTTEQIAKKLGKTLIAPVMAYVPEGKISPEPTGHMKFPGTVSLPETIFENVLEAAIKSYITHGFKTVLIIGDSGDSMKSQDNVAGKLDKAWKSKNVRIFHIDEYYQNNGQTEWLKNKGYSQKDIGFHAGIRDTSELLAVKKEGVRSKPVYKKKEGSTGQSGKSIYASKAIGEQMLKLKIQAALVQIRKKGIE